MQKLNPLKYSRRIATFLGVMAILLLLTVACQHRPATMQYHTLSHEGWKSIDTLFFEIDSLTKAGTYNLHAAVRTTASHPYDFRQLVVEVRQHWLPDSIVQVDTVTFKFAEPVSEQSGKGVSVFTYELPTVTMHHPVGAKAHVEVRHLMRRTPLHGINDVGICLK